MEKDSTTILRLTDDDEDLDGHRVDSEEDSRECLFSAAANVDWGDCKSRGSNG